MNIINKLDRYLTDTEYKIIITPNTINIINYTKVLDFTTTKIVVENQNQTTTIEGTNLVISRMQDNEILITGLIQSIKL